ncbi:MAG: N-acetylmuramoyl-L-alanine amidase [Balneolaceae bacterium]
MTEYLTQPRSRYGFHSFILLIVIFLSSAALLRAQTNFERISTAERSDGEGFVVRHHLSQPVDSFRVIQPESGLVQLMIYSEEIDTTDIRVAEASDVFHGFQLYKLPSGYGIDIELGEGHFFYADAYHDRNSSDLLLGLTKTSKDEVALLTENISPIPWHRFANQNQTGEENLTISSSGRQDESYMRIHDNLTFDTVVIDAGHGGKDPGSIGYNGLREKDVTLAVALKVGEYIEKNLPEVDVIYTRDDDRFLELEERGSVANRSRGDLFVSIHANAFSNRNARGSEVYFMGLARSESALEVMKRENSVVHLESDNGVEELTEEDLLIYELANAGNLTISEQIAEKMEYQFRERAQRRSRGVKQAQFVVLYHASMPALLVEMGFLTNPNEAQFLSSEYGQAIIASAIFRAIRDYKVEYERSHNSLTRSEEVKREE